MSRYRSDINAESSLSFRLRINFGYERSGCHLSVTLVHSGQTAKPCTVTGPFLKVWRKTDFQKRDESVSCKLNRTGF